MQNPRNFCRTSLLSGWKNSVAQLVRNQQVGGSSPPVGSTVAFSQRVKLPLMPRNPSASAMKSFLLKHNELPRSKLRGIRTKTYPHNLSCC
jgi:hypothetical protein